MTDDSPSLKQRIRRQAEREGGLSVAAYMTLALHDRRQGYYAGGAALGARGDFITAPEVSPFFAALAAEWVMAQAARIEAAAGETAHLLELGPGRGVIALALAKAGTAAGRLRPIVLMESDPNLRARQQDALAFYAGPLTWIEDPRDLPEAPIVLFANEFLDCLPIRQFVRDGDLWRERMVVADPANPDGLAFALGAPVADDLIVPSLRRLGHGALVETRPGAEQWAEILAGILSARPGAALFIDYGPAQSEPGDTLQALMGHAKLDPLAAPGRSDLTARVDFAAFSSQCQARGLTVQGPIAQASLLESWGLAELVQQARAQLPPEHAARLERGAERLTRPDQMGELFKALAIGAPGHDGDLFALG